MPSPALNCCLTPASRWTAASEYPKATPSFLRRRCGERYLGNSTTRWQSFLLDRGADPNPAVFTVTFQGGDEVRELLHRYGADWQQRFNGRTPLMDLMYFKRPAASGWLIAHGVDVNATDPSGKTALHFAAMRGIRADYVHALLDAGADIGVEDAQGKTPGDYAVANKRKKLIDLLA